MCGINGFSSENTKEQIAAMNACLAHRGADASASYHDDAMHLGHALFAIRNASAYSKQPFSSTRSPWVLLFDGQIYNTKQLKKTLGLKTPSPSTDTAILYKTIEAYGWDFIQHIHGMYAIALYNTAEKKISLYRDPSGQKTLYYYYKDGEFIFSSEIKALLAYPHLDRSVDYDAVTLAAHFGYIPGPKTLCAYIRKVNPSECVTFDLATRQRSRTMFESRASRYFDENINLAFTQLVREHAQGRKNIAINLRGDCYSSLLMHEMAHADCRAQSYTNRFDVRDAACNEDAEVAKKLACAYGADHHEIHVTKETYCDNFIESYARVEEPNFNISLPIHLQTAKAYGARGDNHRAALSCDGGDELFGGHPYYRNNPRMDAYIRLLTPALFNRVTNYRATTNLNFEHIPERWFFFKHLCQRHTKSNTLDAAAYSASLADAFFEHYNVRSDSVYQCMLMDRLIGLAGDNFVRSEKLFMSEAIELRSPFSFHPFRLYIDEKSRVENPHGTRPCNKTLLRALCAEKLPHYITHRRIKKSGTAPIARWYDRRFKNLFLEILSPMQGTNGLIDWDGVIKHVQHSDRWPGTYAHLYLSLAILSQKYKLNV